MWNLGNLVMYEPAIKLLLENAEVSGKFRAILLWEP